MRIIGCDLHVCQQSLAMLETATGEMTNLTLMHEGNEVREFLFPAPAPRTCGHRRHRTDALVSELDGRAGDRMPGRPSCHDSSCGARKQKDDRREGELILRLLAEKRLPANWLPSKELLICVLC